MNDNDSDSVFQQLCEAPDSNFQADITLIVNNLSPNNIDDKAKQVFEIMKNQQYSPWFAQYIVERIGVEANFHDLYLKFLDKLDLKSLNLEIVKATYEKCKVLLKSNLIKSSAIERLMLKNLGSWLGKITIGKNKVLRGREIDPKSLVIEAYEKGLMIAMIPFTSKILESCSNSVAYQPPNPWTVGILGLLAEIHDMPNLKMNLLIEIDVLFKNLGFDLKDVTRPSLLKDRVREVEGNPDFSHVDYGSSQPKKGRISTSSKVEANIEQQGVINNNVQPNSLGLHFQSPLPLAMKIAVEEIFINIVPLCVSIATETTKELVLKDFLMEPDETILCHAAKLMVARLARRLAYATCKEPLRRSLLSLLRSTWGFEQAVGLVTNDNLEHGCALIEQAAAEQAVETIDGEILHELRRRKRGPKPGQLLRASV